MKCQNKSCEKYPSFGFEWRKPLVCSSRSRGRNDWCFEQEMPIWSMHVHVIKNQYLGGPIVLFGKMKWWMWFPKDVEPKDVIKFQILVCNGKSLCSVCLIEKRVINVVHKRCQHEGCDHLVLSGGTHYFVWVICIGKMKWWTWLPKDVEPKDVIKFQILVCSGRSLCSVCLIEKRGWLVLLVKSANSKDATLKQVTENTKVTVYTVSCIFSLIKKSRNFKIKVNEVSNPIIEQF